MEEDAKSEADIYSDGEDSAPDDAAFAFPDATDADAPTAGQAHDVDMAESCPDCVGHQSDGKVGEVPTSSLVNIAPAVSLTSANHPIPQAVSPTTVLPDISSAERQRSAQRASRRQRSEVETELQTDYVELKPSQPGSADVDMAAHQEASQAGLIMSSYIGSSAPSQDPPSRPRQGQKCHARLLQTNLTSDRVSLPKRSQSAR